MKRSPISTGAKSLERGSTFSAKPKPAKRRPISPASPAQRAKVALQVCAVCCADGCDPAHLAARGIGGCDDADCVIALCRAHHREFDSGALDLLPHLSNRGFARELAHMQWHYADPLSLIQRLSGERWTPAKETT